MTREKRAKVLKKKILISDFFFLTQDCLNPMLESTYFFPRKGKKGYERGGGFPIANNDTILVNPRARRT
jgi:hypothetical protein